MQRLCDDKKEGRMIVLVLHWSSDIAGVGFESSWDIVELSEAKQTYLDFMCCYSYKMYFKCLFFGEFASLCSFYTYIVKL